MTLMNMEKCENQEVLQQNNIKEYKYINIVKGIGIFLVIWGHIILKGPMYNFIYAFHMPLFFFVSGMLYNNYKYNNIKDFFLARTKKLLVPYLIYSIITFLIWALIENNIVTKETNILNPFLQIFLAQGSAGYMIHNIPMWFVTCLFVVEILYFYIDKYCIKWQKSIMIILLAILGFLLTKDIFIIDGTAFVWSIEVAFVALTFYYIGNLLRNNIGIQNFEDKILNKKSISVVLTLIGILVLGFLSNKNPDVSMGSDNFGNIVLFFINAFIGIAIVFNIGVLINKNKLLEFMGKHSFFIMATHFIVRKPIILILAKFLGIESVVIYEDILLSLISTIITLIVELVMIYMIQIIKEKVNEKKSISNIMWNSSSNRHKHGTKR